MARAAAPLSQVAPVGTSRSLGAEVQVAGGSAGARRRPRSRGRDLLGRGLPSRARGGPHRLRGRGGGVLVRRHRQAAGGQRHEGPGIAGRWAGAAPNGRPKRLPALPARRPGGPEGRPALARGRHGGALRGSAGRGPARRPRLGRRQRCSRRPLCRLGPDVRSGDILVGLALGLGTARAGWAAGHRAHRRGPRQRGTVAHAYEPRSRGRQPPVHHHPRVQRGTSVAQRLRRPHRRGPAVGPAALLAHLREAALPALGPRVGAGVAPRWCCGGGDDLQEGVRGQGVAAASKSRAVGA
mmetsp:Transcript_52436/g.170244  ORF Transcript_52436/g.170244 Transcript_52436/m.170244 type:complete len:296 (-) Transcript_52436:141-1028(-)